MPRGRGPILVAVRVAWTGHRPELFRDANRAQETVTSIASALREQYDELSFLLGGQRGVDTWAALAAQRLQVPFEIVLPLPAARFAEDWTAEERATLEATVAAATRLRVVGGGATSAYSARNRVLADEADLLVAVWTGRGGGGTAETIRLAREAGVQMREIRLDPSPSAKRASGRGV